MSLPSDAEIETQRQEALARIREALYGLDGKMEEGFGPGTLGCHEALHATSIALDMVERHVLDHPSIAVQPDWYRAAAKAHHYLFELYQMIGGAHVSGELPLKPDA